MLNPKEWTWKQVAIGLLVLSGVARAVKMVFTPKQGCPFKSTQTVNGITVAVDGCYEGGKLMYRWVVGGQRSEVAYESLSQASQLGFEFAQGKVKADGTKVG